MAAGDLAIVGFGADSKSFAYVLLDAALIGQSVSFTDNGWLAAGGFRANEGTLTVTIPANATVGQVFTVTGLTSQFNPSTAGDQILAYTGSATNPSFLFAVDFADGNSTWASDATSSNTSAVPTGLTNGVNALAFFPLDNAAYTGPTTGTKAEILANIANTSNWTRDDAAAPAYPTAFTVGSGVSISINDVSVSEGDSGTSLLTFTVTRTANTTAFSVDFATADGTATAGSDYVATSGTLSFTAGGALTQTISVTINGDTVVEPTESFTVGLSNLVNTTGTTTISDNSGTGTITNDDITVTKISAIQGPSFFSPILAGDGITAYNTASTSQVTVKAVVTAIDSFSGSDGVTGFYLMEEQADWDANANTSEGIFVRTSNLTGITVGETVTVTANVMEFQNFTNLPRTFLVNPTVTQDNDSVALPTLVLDGTAGKAIPNKVLSDDNPDFKNATGTGGGFDPQNDALDFYETIEGMRVTVTNMVVADGFVGGSNDNFVFFNAYSTDHADASRINVRGGYTVTGDPQFYPVDTADPLDNVNFGGRNNTDGVVNPDILELDFGNTGRGGTSGFDQDLTMGDSLGNVTGIIDFDFGTTKLYVTDALDPVKVAALAGNTPIQEVTTLTADARSLRVATFNVENLSPVGTTFSTNNGVEITAQTKFDKLAANIANNLLSPDILIVQEVQDNNGVTADSTVDASTTWGQLVAAVNAATGKTYQWVDEAPLVSGDVGGAPGGNIRVGFLYDTARVQLGNLAANATLTERRQFTDRIGDGVRDAGDLISVDDTGLGINTADWSGTRRSIVGEFNFNGQTVHVFGSHLPSKGGSDDFYEIDQNNGNGVPANGGWATRNALAQQLWSVQNKASTAGSLVVSGGDFNEYWFYRPLEVATGYATADGQARIGGTRYSNLMVDKLAPVERFSYDFDGRSQALDTLLADQTLAGVAQFDVVHINTGYNDRTGAVNPASSDHDPSLARFDFSSLAERLNGSGGADLLQGFGGNDSLAGGLGNDTLEGGTGADSLNGGDGIDTVTFANAATGVTLNLATGGTGGEAAGDSYTGIENVTGSNWADDITGDGTANAINSGAGADTVRGGNGNDTINGGGGGDALFGDDGDDLFVVTGNQKFASIDGGTGNDVIVAGANNTPIAWAAITGIETISGGGFANVVVQGQASADAINLTALTLTGIAAVDGGSGNDTITGSAGDDNLRGAAGADMVNGGNGNDTIAGGIGVDTLTGGAGGDRFVFLRGDSGGTASYADRITDFGAGDLIDLSGWDAVATTAALDGFDFIGTSLFERIAGQLRYSVVGGVLQLSGDTNGDGRADFMILLNGLTSLSEADLII